MGSPFGKYFLASVWLTTATLRLFAVSAGLMGRPATIEIPAVSKYCPETRFKIETMFSFGPGVYPEREMFELHEPPLIGGVAESAAERTAGIADSRSRRAW